jgi:hypothetical protein
MARTQSQLAAFYRMCAERTEPLDPARFVQNRIPYMVQHCTSYGLANRLRGWCGIGALADIAGVPFVTCWKPVGGCPSTFIDIFVPDSCAVFAHGAAFTRARRVWRGKQATLPTNMYARRRRNGHHVAKQRALSLKLRPHLQEQLDSFTGSLPPDIVGVHIRRTDLLRVERRRKLGDQRLLRILDARVAAQPDTAFLLCADNPLSVEMMVKRYGKRVFWRKQTMTDYVRGGGQCSSIGDAAIDLYALSRTSRIIASPGSSFAQYAGYLGGIKLRRIRS